MERIPLELLLLLAGLLVKPFADRQIRVASAVIAFRIAAWIARTYAGVRWWIATATVRRTRSGKLEVLGIESADPRWVRASIEQLLGTAYRLRALGTIASSLCQVAAARFDGMVSLRKARGVDCAAGQLIVREAGGCVSFPGCPEPLAAPLDAVPSSPVVAARTREVLRELEQVPA